ncbi:MAG: TfoX/Sxy family protein [Deltaproteobacteria bacterium]|nr:TfoX/Sxy family protein [Deltaproteobacteria bacterium]
MAYDERLAERIRQAVGPRADVTEKKMFGGIAFLLDGKMFAGVVKDDLMVRVGPELYEAALAEANVRPMDFTGKAMSGYVFVGPDGSRTEKAVRRWVDRGAAFAGTLEGARKSGAKKRSR